MSVTWKARMGDIMSVLKILQVDFQWYEVQYRKTEMSRYISSKRQIWLFSSVVCSNSWL